MTVFAPYADARQKQDQQVILRIARDFFRPGMLDELSVFLGKPVNQIKFDYSEYLIVEKAMLDPEYSQLGSDDIPYERVVDADKYAFSGRNAIVQFYRYALTIDRAIQHMRLLDSYIAQLNKINTPEAVKYLFNQLPANFQAYAAADNPKGMSASQYPITRMLDMINQGRALRRPDMPIERYNVTRAGDIANLSMFQKAGEIPAELARAFKRSTARISLFNMFIKLVNRHAAALQRSTAAMGDEFGDAISSGPMLGSALKCGAGMIPKFVDKEGNTVPYHRAVVNVGGKEYVNTGIVDMTQSSCEPTFDLGARRRRRRVAARKPTVHRRRRVSHRLPSLAELMSARTRRHRRRPATVHRRRRVSYRANVASSAFADPAGLTALGSHATDKLPFKATARRVHRRRRVVHRRPVVHRRRRVIRRSPFGALVLTPGEGAAAARRVHRRRRVARRPVRRVVRRTVRKSPYGASSILRALAITPMDARRRRRTVRRPVVHRRRRPVMRAMSVVPSVSMAARRRRRVVRRRPAVHRVNPMVHLNRMFGALTIKTNEARRRRRRVSRVARPVVRRRRVVRRF